MRSFAFYSIKGGTGRSLSLANVAFILAKRGKRIVCVDFDVMAPGLVSIFNIPRRVYENKPSVIDLLLALGDSNLGLESLIDMGEILGLKSNQIWLIHAKPETKEKYRKLSKNNLWSVASMNLFKTNYLKVIYELKQLDYLFVDSRSGLSPDALYALTLAERNVVLFTRMDTQSISGTLHFLNLLRNYNFNLNLILVVTNVPPGEKSFTIKGVQFKLKREAVARIKELDRSLKGYDVQVSCILPFNEDFLLDPKLIYPEEQSQIAAGYRLLSDLIEEVKEGNKDEL